MRLFRTFLFIILTSILSCKHAPANKSANKEFTNAKATPDFESPETQIPIKLKKAGSIEHIAYRVQLSIPDEQHLDVEEQAYHIRIKFPHLTKQDFDRLKESYATNSEVLWIPGKVYYLEDFLTPFMQAVVEHHFGIQNETIDAMDSPSGKGLILSPMTQCFSTAYEASRNSKSDFQIYSLLDSKTVSKLLDNDKLSTLIRDYKPESSDPKTGIAERNKGLKFGDYVVIYQTLPNKPEVAVHAAIWVDEDLFFEKTGLDDNLSYRLVYINDLLKGYPTSVHKKWRYRRFDKGPLPQVDKLVSANIMYPNEPDVSQLPQLLRNNMIFSSSSEGHSFSNFSPIMTVRLEKDPSSGRYQLPKLAFDPFFYDGRSWIKMILEGKKERSSTFPDYLVPTNPAKILIPVYCDDITQGGVKFIGQGETCEEAHEDACKQSLKKCMGGRISRNGNCVRSSDLAIVDIKYDGQGCSDL